MESELEPHRKRRGVVPPEALTDGKIYEVTLRIQVRANTAGLRGKPWREGGSLEEERVVNVALEELNRIYWEKPRQFYELANYKEVKDAGEEPGEEAGRPDPEPMGQDLGDQER
jgi:hypothetical protein